MPGPPSTALFQEPPRYQNSAGLAITRRLATPRRNPKQAEAWESLDLLDAAVAELVDAPL